jgi:putative membrane protein
MGVELLLDTAGWHWWFAPFWVLFWIAVIVVIWRFVPWRGRCGGRRSDAREILAERFARGEIDAAEYAARRDVLSQ